jgi:hypothetical protein
MTVFLPGRIDTPGPLGVDEKFALLQGRKIFPFAVGSCCATCRGISDLLGLHLLIVLTLVVRSRDCAQGLSEDSSHQNNEYFAHDLLLVRLSRDHQGAL